MAKETVEDFQNQFNIFNTVDEYSKSNELLENVIYPFDSKKVENKVIADIGCGSGRYIRPLSKLKPNKIYAIEPSEAIYVAKKNNADIKNVNYVNSRAQDIDIVEKIDIAFSLGVVHHIPDAIAALKGINKSLKDGGYFIMFLYAYEGNKLYVFIFNSLRRITSKVNDRFLKIFSILLNFIASSYGLLTKALPLYMHKYFRNVFMKSSFRDRTQIIFDQLNPKYSKYYKKQEVVELATNTGFEIVDIYHRNGNAWVGILKKPNN